MSDDQPVRTKRRKMRGVYCILIMALVVVLGLVGLFWWRGKSQLQMRIEALRAAGHPISYAELDDRYSIPNDVGNAADVVLDAISWYREPNRPELVAVVGGTELPGRTKGLSAEMKQAIGEYLASNNKTLELLHEAGGIEHSRYTVNYNAGISITIPSLSSILNMARLLKAEAVMHVEDNQADQAVKSTAAIFGVARSLSDEPVMISQIARMVCEAIGVSAIERIVNRGNLDDEQLAELDRIIAGAGSGLNFARALMAERCLIIDILRDPAKRGPQVGSPRITGVLPTVLKTVGLTDKVVILCLDFADEFMQVTELPEHNRIAAVKALDRKFEESSGIRMKMLQIIPPRRTPFVEKDLRSIALLRAARVGLAVERHRLAAGKLPGTLAELVGEYLNAAGNDPFDGEQLRYIRLEEGFVVYSIGKDGRDDGGKEHSKGDNDSQDITFTVER